MRVLIPSYSALLCNSNLNLFTYWIDAAIDAIHTRHRSFLLKLTFTNSFSCYNLITISNAIIKLTKMKAKRIPRNLVRLRSSALVGRGPLRNRRVPRSVGVASQHRRRRRAASFRTVGAERRKKRNLHRRENRSNRAWEGRNGRRRSASALGVAAHASPRRRDAGCERGADGRERERERERETDRKRGTDRRTIGITHSWRLIPRGRRRELSRLRTVERTRPVPPSDVRARGAETETRRTRTIGGVEVSSLASGSRARARARLPTFSRAWLSKSGEKPTPVVNATPHPSPLRYRWVGTEEAPLRERSSVSGVETDDVPGKRRRQIRNIRARFARDEEAARVYAAVRRDSGRIMWKWILRAWCTTLRGTASSSASRWVRLVDARDGA